MEVQHLYNNGIVPDSQQKVATHPNFKGQIIYSFDNDRAHTKAVPYLEAAGVLNSSNRAPLPALSPDMHKVVEHTHALLMYHFNEMMETLDDRPRSVDFYIEKLREIFFREVTPEIITKDTRTLRATYRAIIAADGGYICKALS
jgi:hypothetical protein